MSVSMIPACRLCPRRCGAGRDGRSGGGFCGMQAAPVVARAALHHGEEPCISGTRGSGAVFFSGCTLRCLFCQNASISRERFGRAISAGRLADIFRELVEQGAHNINLVSPTPFVPAILAAVERYRPPVPIVYNTGGYETLETLRLLDGVVDVYLPDFKYRDAALAARLSGAADYPERAAEAVLEMARQTGPMRLDAEGLAQKGTLVRHLVLPGHTRDSIAVLDWLADHLPAGCWISLLSQYTPSGMPAGAPELGRRLTAREYDKVFRHMAERGLVDGYAQERSSAGQSQIPAFDLTGVIPPES